MAESRPPFDGLPLRDDLKSPEVGEKSFVNKALTETAKFLFPHGTLLNSWVVEGYPKSKMIWSAFGGFVDVGRIVGAANFTKHAADADSTKAIIGFSALAAGFLSPNLVHLASKSRLIRETGKKIERGVANAVLGKFSRFKGSSLEK